MVTNLLRKTCLPPKSESRPCPTFRGCGQSRSICNRELFSELARSNTSPQEPTGLMLNSLSPNQAFISNSSRQTSPVCTELEKAHSGLLGIGHYPRVQNVTGFGKTLRMGFFVKTEFDASLISSTLELTHLHV